MEPSTWRISSSCRPLPSPVRKLRLNPYPIPALIRGAAVPARLAPNPATPAYVQYEKPPLSFDGDAIGIGEFDGFRSRIRIYDYGVVSVGLQRPFEGSWAELSALGQMLIESP